MVDTWGEREATRVAFAVDEVAVGTCEGEVDEAMMGSTVGAADTEEDGKALTVVESVVESVVYLA